MPFYSKDTTEASGLTATFTVPFDYLEQSDVHVKVDGVEVTPLVFPSSGQVTLPSTPAAGADVLVYRTTDVAELSATFSTRNVLDFRDLNKLTKQLLFVTQEGFDKAVDLEAITNDALATVDAANQLVTDAAAAVAASQATIDQLIIDTEASIANTLAGAVAAKDAALVAQAAAEAAAASVNPTSFLAKADNLSGLGDVNVAKANLVLHAVATSGSYNDLTNKPTIRGLFIGQLAWCPFQTPPDDWLVRDGAAIEIAVYPLLAAAIYVGDANNATAEWGYKATTNINPSSNRSTSGTYIVLPDDRGIFERGWDNGAGVDTDRVFGSLQQDAVKNHTHTASTSTTINNGTGVFRDIGGANLENTSPGPNTGKSTITASSSTTVNAGGGGTETRPKNRAYLPVIYAGE